MSTVGKLETWQRDPANEEIVSYTHDTYSLSIFRPAIVDPNTEARGALAAAAPEMYRVLHALEWGQGPDLRCPSCQGPGTHTNDCALGVALKKAEGMR